MNVTQIPVIIPAYEPDDRLISLCEQLHNAHLCVIIIDDGSGEGYQSIFKRIQDNYDFTILRIAVNLGKGRALKLAFNMLDGKKESCYE